VLTLGVCLLGIAPQPMTEADFFRPESRGKTERLFENLEEMTKYALFKAGPDGRLAFFEGSEEKMLFGSGAGPKKFLPGNAEPETSKFSAGELLKRNSIAALKAITLLTVPIFLVLFFIVREKLPQRDEILLGIFLCISGMAIFGIGIELGLDKLGTQVGSKLPVSFKAVPLVEAKKTIPDFDPRLVQIAISPEGEKHPFFYARQGSEYIALPYDPKAYDADTGRYIHTPFKGPLFGRNGWAGFGLVLLFAFVMGYGATLAEPALNALGLTVEELTAGTFKKPLLIQAVAVGVGTGIALGVGKIIWDIPLAWLLVPPYLLLILVTKFSTEEFVNIGWDSAGVTTGPITVPLVLTMGLGIGSQVGVVEGFGILATASVCPILSVLLLGLHINRKRQAALNESIRGPRNGENPG
jgi:hypothetical protein